MMKDSIGVSSQNDVISTQVDIGTDDADETKVKQLKENLQKYEQLFGADEDAFDQPTTTRKELWSYYLYYNVSICTQNLCTTTNKFRVTMALVPGPTLKHYFNLL